MGAWKDPWTGKRLVEVEIPTVDGSDNGQTGGALCKTQYYCPACDDLVGVFWGLHVHCPACGSSPREHTLENYDPMWKDGDIVCRKCRTRVRGYDAG